MGQRSFQRLAGLALSGAALLAAATAPAAHAVAPAPPDGKPDFDARAGDRAAVPAATADARDALSKRLGPQATVAADPVTGGLRAVGRSDGFLTGPSTADPAVVALAYARDHADAFGLTAADLATLRLATRTTSGDGVTHLTFQQLDGGVAAYDSALSANVTADGRLVNAGGAPVHDLQAPGTDPPLGPGAARAAAQRDLGVAPDGTPGTVGADAARTTTFAGTDDVASLVTLADPDGDRLAWKLTVAGEAPYVYEVLVDAATGAILTRHSLTDFATAGATVHELHPGDGTDHTADLGAWISTPVTRLSGPNAHAYADRSSPDGIGGDSEIAPNPSPPNFTFAVTPATPASGQFCPTAFATICTWDGGTVQPPSSAATANVAQATTQVFYYVNRYHDWLAQPPIGFTPSSSNFEAGGPHGSDPVNAETDDYSGVSNANMSTPPDGQPGKLQMYLFQAPYPAVNGADDATVVYHEYTHGMTNRLVGGDGQANGLVARQSQAMGEGWSDWYAMDYLTDQGQITDTAAPGDEVVGAYVTDDTKTGIRYNAVDCPVGASSSHCPGTTLTGPGGFTFGDLGRVIGYSANYPVFEVHADGEIWSETLWDLRRAVGATTARSLITSALRLSPKQPTFLDMRDAILAADTVAGGADRAQIWAVFAARGMGYSASVTSANATRATEAFDLPPIVAGGAADAPAAALEQDTVVHVPVVNPGTTPLTGVHATLASATPGVSVPQATAELGTIAPKGTAVATFSVHAAAAAGCGTLTALSLAVATDQGSRTVPYTLPIGTGTTTAGTRSYSTPATIPNNAPATGLTSTLSVPTHGRVGHLRVTLAATHTWIGDLHAWLTSPSGTTVDLFERPGTGTSTSYSAGNLVASTPLVLDDDATAPIQELAGADTTVGGLYEPNQPLARFADEDRYGTWTLRVTDSRALDAGTLSSWSLESAAPACAITDAPSGLVADAATFHARVDPGPAATSAAFELGHTTAYGARSPTIGVLAGRGLQTITTSTPGLTPGATYHVRAVALRNGVVVAAGADRTFVAGVEPAPSSGRNGDDAGAGSGGGGGTGGSGTAPLAPSTPTTPTSPPMLTVPKATMKDLVRTLRLDRKGRVTMTFRATPAKARGSIAVGGATKAFTVPASGRVKVTLTASRKLRSALRTKAAARKGVKAKATIKIGVTSFTATLTIKPYKKAKAR